MADNVTITAGTGTTILADELTDGTLGSGKAQFIKIMDGTLDSSNKLVIDSSGNAMVKVNAALPTGANVIGALTANQSINNVQLNGTTVDTNSGNKSAGTQRIVLATDQPNLTTPLNTNTAQINGVTVTMGNGASGTGVQRVTIASDSTGQVALAAGSATIGNVISVPTTSGGTSSARLNSAATNNATNVKASAGQVYSITAQNRGTVEHFIKLYNKSSSPAPATDNGVLLHVEALQPGQSIHREFTNGIPFASGISYAVVKGVSDTDNTSADANAVLLTVGYK